MNAVPQLPISGHCYCGAVSLVATSAPRTVTYCHCNDCRRATGAPVVAVAAFNESDVKFSPDEGKKAPSTEDGSRSFCGACGTPTVSRFNYLPGQVYIPVGLLDQADQLAPEVHSYNDSRLPWLNIDDDLERFGRSSRSHLNAAQSPTSQDRSI